MISDNTTLPAPKGTPTSSATREILHVDADAFFASVEQALKPELRGLPVIVGGGNRGVVSAASYEARPFGVKSAMPMVTARRLCPGAVFLPPNFRAYSDYSARMFRIMGRYSPSVLRASVDEGYMDLTGTERLHGAPPWEIAHRILQDIRRELGINVSGGLAASKCWAKIATELAKPNGLLWLNPETAHSIMYSLPVGMIPGVGKKTEAILKGQGVHLIKDLVSAPANLIRRVLGSWGPRLVETARGERHGEIFAASEGQKSYSKDRTLDADTRDYDFVLSVARHLLEQLAGKLRRDGKAAGTLTIKVRYKDFKENSRSRAIKPASNVTSNLLAALDGEFPRAITSRAPIRLIGVKLSGICEGPIQTNLFDASLPKKQALDKAVDKIRQKHGYDTVKYAYRLGS
jgi:DNA polymerase-4